MTPAEAVAYCADQVRRYDHDRFLVCAFAPAAVRDDFFAFYAFNLELARVRETVNEPLLGRMRLQWWRDQVAAIYGEDGGEAAIRDSAVVKALSGPIVRHGLTRAWFETLIDARERDLELGGPATLVELTAYAQATTVPLVRLCLEALGWRKGPAAEGADAVAEAARLVGTGYALTGLVRAVPFLLRQRRLSLPEDRLRAHGVRIGRLFDFLKGEPGLAAVAAEVAAVARDALAGARCLAPKLPRRLLPAFRLATVADLYLAQLAAARYDPLAPDLARSHPLRAAALAWSVLRGRF